MRKPSQPILAKAKLSKQSSQFHTCAQVIDATTDRRRNWTLPSATELAKRNVIKEKKINYWIVTSRRRRRWLWCKWKVGNQVRRAAKFCRKLFNFGFINCLVGSFLFVFWETKERERGEIQYLLNWVKWCPPRGTILAFPAKQKTKTKLYGDRENKWNCNEIDQESVLFSFNYCTHQFTFELFLISVLVGLNYRTKRKREMKNVWFWFLFDLFYFLAPQL